jgi:hypothetical protein
VVEDGRVHPGLVPAEDEGNLVSLVTRRVWDVAGGGGDLAKPLVRQGKYELYETYLLYSLFLKTAMTRVFD